MSRSPFRFESQTLALPRFAAASGSRPFVLALEGPNGAGKTTLCRKLARRLGAPSCLGTDEAWFSETFKTRMIRDAEWHASAMFFLSGCFEQMRLLRTRREPLVVMDRSMWSTLAVHAATQPARLSVLLEMLRPISSKVQVPDLTLVLEASFATCQSRIGRKTGEARALDGLTANAAFHSREQAFYHWLAKQAKNVCSLDVESAKAAEVAESALKLVLKKLRW